MVAGRASRVQAPDDGRVRPPETPTRLLERCGDAPCVVTGSASWSGNQTAALVRGAAACLREAGVGPGDRLALIAPPTPAALVAVMASWEIGATIVPLHLREPAATLARWVGELECRLVLAPPAWSSDVPCPIVACDVTRWSRRGEGDGGPAVDPAPGGTMLRTSGSSGRPRLVVHDVEQHLESARVVGRHLHYGGGARWLLALPLYHVGGLAILARALACGGAIALAGALPLEVAIERLAVTHVSLVATQLRRLLDARASRHGPGTLRAVVVGGGPLPGALASRASAQGLPLVHTYGCTEMASMVTATELAPPVVSSGPGRAPRRAGELAVPADAPSAGRVLPGRELTLAASGEIRVAGASLCRGYLDPSTGELTDPRDADGLFPTGDRGQLAPDGSLRVLGRMDNLMISGGENIQAEEVEEALLRCAGVCEALVIALPDEEFGERPAAFVRMAAGRAMDAGAMRSEVATILPRFKVPDHIWAWPEGRDAGRGRLKPDREELARLGIRLAARRG